MKFDKKFNVKHLITISAVALAMIGGGVAMTNVNDNVHADSDSAMQQQLRIVSAQDKKSSAQASRDETHAAYVAAKNNPQILANDLEYHPDWIKGHRQELFNRLTPQQRKTIKQLMAFENGESDYAPSDKDLGGDSLSSTQLDAYAKKHTPTPKMPSIFNNKPTHKSRSMNTDRRAINNDKNQLSTRRARKAMNNYKRNHKATRYVKHLIQINKDLTKREKDLARTTKLNHKTRSTKRNSHRSSKRIRKNKNAKRNRNHKRINKRNRKHMKRNAHKHTRRNQRNRK